MKIAIGCDHGILQVQSAVVTTDCNFHIFISSYITSPPLMPSTCPVTKSASAR